MDKPLEPANESNRTLIILVAVGAAVVIAVLFYLLMRVGSGNTGTNPVLEGAIRPGAPEWQQLKERIVVDSVEADEAKRALGDTVMTLRGTVRNFTGRTLNGLEIKAAVVDHQDKSVKERTVIVVPTRQSELAPNKTLGVQVMLEGFKDTDDRANIKMEVTGFRFKE
jgi:hypothetical protein